MEAKKSVHSTMIRLLVSERPVQEEVERVEIIPSVNSDHLAIVLHFNSIEKQKFGPSYWKFMASLLEDSEFLLLINQKIPEWCIEVQTLLTKEC